MDIALPEDGWRFMAFVNERGEDAITEWFESRVPVGEERGVWTYFRTILRHLRFVPIHSWRKPQFRWLSGDRYKGIGEIRFQYHGVAYRPLGCFGPGEDQFTILIGCRKTRKRKGETKWIPMSAPDTALARRAKLIEERQRRIYEIDLDQNEASTRFS